MFTNSCSTRCILIVAYVHICKGGYLLEVKVPLICPSTAGVPARREGRYETSGIDATGDLKGAKITLSVAAIDSQLSISTSGDHRIFLGPGTPTGLPCILDYLEDFADTLTQVLCIWIGDFRYNQEGTPSIMILQGETFSAHPQCYSAHPKRSDESKPPPRTFQKYPQ
jgi:hypothetical protein